VPVGIVRLPLIRKEDFTITRALATELAHQNVSGRSLIVVFHRRPTYATVEMASVCLWRICDSLAPVARPRDLIRPASCRPEVLASALPSPRTS